VTLRLPLRTRNRFVAKVITTCLIAVIIGVAFNKSELAEYQRGQQLTLAQYTANFEVFRTGLMEHHWPLVGDILLWLAALVLFFGVYELLTLGIAKALDQLFAKRRELRLPDVAA
jgi:hypothetical protein